jgi:hypothetical protein
MTTTPSSKAVAAHEKISVLETKLNITPMMYDASPSIMSKCYTCKNLTDTIIMQKKTSPSGKIYPTICNVCMVNHRGKKQITREVYISKIVSSCRSSIRRKNRRGRNLLHTLTPEIVMNMLSEQDGKCKLSGQLMSYIPGSDFQLSIERVDESQGYTKENCILVALEFNGNPQFTQEKVEYVFTHTDEVDHNAIGLANTPMFVALETSQQLKYIVMVGSQQLVKCYGCSIAKAANQFSNNEDKAYAVLCDSCKSLKADHKNNPYFSKITQLLKNSRAHTEQRKNAGRTGMEGEISYDEILEIFTCQQGLCAVSGTRLRPSGNFKMSLERIDPTLGYYPWNCSLIAAEFNTGDMSAVQKKSTTGSCGWTRGKYLKVRSDYIEKRNKSSK